MTFHNDCLAACGALRARDPELTAEYDTIRAAYGPMTIGSPVHRLDKDFRALNEAALGFGSTARAKKLIGELL